MEKTKDAVVATMDIGWNDVGAWSSLWELGKKDSSGNVITGDIVCHETENSYIYTESGLVATIGIQDLVIIHTKDSLLVSRRDSVQNVKILFSILICQDVKNIKNIGKYSSHGDDVTP